MSVTSLVTNGFICYRGQPIPVPAPLSTDTPSVVGVVEVRPKIRYLEADDVGTDHVPTMTTAQELKPSMVGEVPPDEQGATPTQVTAQELKPTIVDVEED